LRRTDAGDDAARGGVVALYTELLVREDNLQLFGFPTLAEREWHRLLITVQGVGAKAALAIAGTLGTDGVARAISLGDVSAIRAAPGIGPKLAQRITIELKDKAPAIMAMGDRGDAVAQVDDTVIDATDAVPAPVPSNTDTFGSAAGARADALSALVNLGYGQGEAAGAIAQAMGDGPQADTQDMIRRSLRLLAPKG